MWRRFGKGIISSSRRAKGTKLIQRDLITSATASTFYGNTGRSSTAFHLISPINFESSQQCRGFKHHAAGWWEDHDGGGDMDDEEEDWRDASIKPYIKYVSDSRKEEIYRLHKLDPDIFDSQILSYLFSLSRVRVEAIIKLKDIEVRQRKSGQLYTEDDDPALNENFENIDPTDLVLEDRESGWDTLEDLTRPPGYVPKGEDLSLLYFQAALQHSKLLDELVPKIGLGGNAEEVLGALETKLQALNDKNVEAGQKLTEDEEQFMRTVEEICGFLEHVSEENLEEAETNLAEIAEERKKEDINDFKQYYDIFKNDERASLHSTSVPNGFKMIENLENHVLEDPDFLYYHCYMGLEKERLELMHATLKAQAVEKGVYEGCFTPYDMSELEHTIEDYVARKQRCAEIFLELQPLHWELLDEEDETKKAELAKREKDLIKVLKEELKPKIVQQDELSEVNEELRRTMNAVAAHDRRVLLETAFIAKEEEKDEKKSKEAWRQYLKLLYKQTRFSLRAEEKSSIQDIKFGALQHHHRILRNSEAGKELYQQIGSTYEHLILEGELMQILESMEEEEVYALPSEDKDKSGEHLQLLKKALAEQGEGRKKGLQTYLLTILRMYSGEGNHQSWEDDRTVGQVAVQYLALDVAASRFRDMLSVEKVARDLDSLDTQRKLQLSENMHLLEEEREAYLNGHVGALHGGGGGARRGIDHLFKNRTEEEKEFKKEIHRALNDLQEKRLHYLQQTMQLKKEEEIRKYLVYLCLSTKLSMFSSAAHNFLEEVKPKLVDLFKGNEKAVSRARQLLSRSIYEGQSFHRGTVQKIAQEVSRHEGTVLKSLDLLLESFKKPQENGGGTERLLPETFVSPLLSHDCFKMGLKSAKALKKFTQQLRDASQSLSSEDFQEAEKEFGLSITVADGKAILENILKKQIGTYLPPSAELVQNLYNKDAPLEDRVRAAKAFLDFLRGHREYQEYAAPLKDQLVDIIEDSLADAGLTYAENTEDFTFDPNYADIKPKAHFDMPSLKFRVMGDNEPNLAKSRRDHFLEEDTIEADLRFPYWRPKDIIPDAYATPAAAPSTTMKQEGGGRRRRRRYGFAFKDTSIEGPGLKDGGTVIRDGKTGRLRAATMDEERNRTWIKKRHDDLDARYDCQSDT